MKKLFQTTMFLVIGLVLSCCTSTQQKPTNTLVSVDNILLKFSDDMLQIAENEIIMCEIELQSSQDNDKCDRLEISIYNLKLARKKYMYAVVNNKRDDAWHCQFDLWVATEDLEKRFEDRYK